MSGQAKSGVYTAAGIIVVLLISVFASFKKPPFYPENLIVHIHEQDENHFVKEEEVIELFRGIRTNNPGIVSNDQIDLKGVEQKLQLYDFIKEAQVSRDLKGNLIVDVHQDRPIARIMAASGKGGYISRERKILGLSENYTSRVIVITGNGADSLFNEGFLNREAGFAITELVDFIREDDLWNIQIAQIDLDKNLHISFFPQLGKQKIEFGTATDLESKFKKLKLFYDEIVPKKGWGTYSTVKLQFEGQIVCE